MDFRDNIIKYEKFDERLKNRDYSKYVGDLFRFTEPKSLHTLACLNESLNKVEPFYEKNGLIDERTWAFDKTSTSFAIGGIIDEHYFNLELKQYLKYAGHKADGTLKLFFAGDELMYLGVEKRKFHFVNKYKDHFYLPYHLHKFLNSNDCITYAIHGEIYEDSHADIFHGDFRRVCYV